MSGIHLFGRLEALLSLTTKTASRIPTSDPIKRSWYIMTAFLRVQDRTTRLNRPVISTIDDPGAMLATIWSSCNGLVNSPASARRDSRTGGYESWKSLLTLVHSSNSSRAHNQLP